MFFLRVSVLAILPILGANGNSVTQTEGSAAICEGEPVLLNCTYQTTGYPTLFWYVRYGNQAPRLFLRDGSADPEEGAALGDSVQSTEPEVSGSQGDSLSLSCSYDTSSSNVYLYWYRQYPHQAPQYMLWRGAKNYRDLGDTAGFARERFSSQANDSATVLSIRALELADTAVYLCALQRAQ
ncbi:T cell receptor alpha variable 12-2 [Chelydra serpentina]|nr:T cell receptor alpha variable 12-2 [Chelydra serpentina]